jgi:L-ascorbate metabolism protein UlaG (beta-lactamase superfamily)
MDTLVPREVFQSPGGHRVHFADRIDVADLARAGASPDVLVWWLGQAGFAVRHPGGTFLIDPYLSDSLAAKYAGTHFPHTRLHTWPVEPAALRGIELVLHSHAHTDHLDPWTVQALLEANRPRFVAPRARRSVALARHIPADLLAAVTAGDQIIEGRLHITPVPAAHETLTLDDQGDHVFLGYVVDVNGIRIYHSGDCAPYEGQAELIGSLGVDVALLPVNGRDPVRLANGVPGNFTLHEAVALCHEAGVPELICHHFGLFDFNTVAPSTLRSELEKIAGDLAWTIPAVGAGFRISTEPTDSTKEAT